MNLKAVSRNVGAALLVSALFMFFSVLVSIANGNDSALSALLISCIITFVVGIFPFIFVSKAPEISLIDGYVIIVFAWLLSFLFGMMPYLLWGGPFTVVNALFESVSGFTTTGATILENVEALPNSLLFWRSATHFIGGLGVVVFLLLIIPSSNPVRFRLTNMELSSLSKDNYHVRANKTVIIYTYVYLALIFASFILYMIAGMSAFDAINHAFSVCATGGFSTRNLSIAAFHSLPISLITIVFMYLSSIHFGLIYFSFVNRSFKPFNNSVLIFYTKATILASIITAVSLKMGGLELTWGKAFLDGTFQLVSFISTTGFAIADNSTWPNAPSMFLIMFALMCGCAGSTAGGIKADRIYILFKSIKRQIMKTIHPSSVEEVKIGDHILKEDEINPHIIFIALYILIVFISMLLCLSVGVGLRNSLVATISTLGNVGPGVGELGTMGNYNMEPAIAKIIYCFDMFLGRLEFYPVLAIISAAFSRLKK